MKYLFKKMLRSIKQFKLQFAAVLLLAMLSVVIYSGLEGIWYGIETGFDAYVEETSMANEWVFATRITDADVAAIRDMRGVTAVSKRLRINVSALDAEGRESYLSLDLPEGESADSMKLINGDRYDGARAGSIWIDSDYAEENGIAIGQTIEISFNGNTAHPQVAGIIMSAEHAHYVGTTDYYIPEHEQYGYGFMSEDLRAELGIPIDCNLLEIESADSAVKDTVNDLLGERFLAYYDRDTLFDVAFVSDQAGNLRRVSLLFSSLFILLAILSMRTTIKRLIDAQSADIATLKSLGFSNRSLAVYYSLYGLFVSVLGAGLGYLGSFPFSKAILSTQKAMISLPDWTIRHTFGSLIVILLIIALSVLASVLAARKALKGLPAEYSKNNAKHAKTTWIERIGHIWNRTGFGMKWTIRDAAVHKVRIFLGIVSVCGSFMLLIVGSGTPDSISGLTSKTYSEEFLYSYKLTLNTTGASDGVEALREELSGQFIQTMQSRVTFDGNSCFKPVTIYSEGPYIGLKTTDGEQIGEGVYVTEGMADKLGLHVGDSVELFPSGSDRSFTFIITGKIPSGMPQAFYISGQCWTDAGADFRPSHIFCGDTDRVDELKNDTRVAQIMSRTQQERNLMDFKVKLTGVFTLMKVIAFALVVIVLYNLSILSFLERTKEYNTFRVLGFHFGEIRKLASFENVIILTFGTLLGIPFGLRFLKVYCATFSNATLKIYAELRGASLTLVCCIVFICTAVTTLLLSRRIRKIDMVQALKE